MQNYNEKNTGELQKKRKEKAKLETIPHFVSKGPLNSNTSNETDSIYYQLFEHNINAVLLTSLNGSIHAANPAACNLFGRTEAELKQIGRNGVVDLTDPRLIDVLKELERTGIFQYELTFIRKDGTKFPGEIESSVFCNKDGNIITCMTIQDISERKKIEQEVSNKKNFYDLILNNVHDGIWVTDEKDRLIYFNSGMEKIAGTKSEDILGLSVIKDFPPETTSQFLKFYHKAKKTLEPQQYEATVVTPAGRKTVQSGWLIPRITDGKYDGMICTIQDITERKQAEEKLQASEIWLHNIFNSLSEGVLVVTPDRKLVNINRTAEVMFGYTKEEVSKLSTEIFHVDHEHYVEFGQKIQKAFDNNMVADFEFKARRKNGEIFPTEHSVSLLKDTKGHQLGIVSVVRDITKRKKNEEMLRQSEEKFHCVAENARDGIMVVKNGERVYCNPRWREIVGYSEEEYKVIPFLSRVHPEDLDFVSKTYKLLINRETFESGLEFRIISKYNETKFVAAKPSCIQWENESADLVVLQDITESKKAEFRLKENEEKYRLLVETLNEGIWKIDAKGYTTFVNSKMAEMLDYSVDEMLGKHLFSFMDEKGVENAKEKMNERRKGIKAQHEFIFQKKNGETVNMLLNASPIYDSQGNYAGSLAGISDITGYIKAMEQIKTNEIRYRELFEHMPSGVAVYDVIDGGKDFIFKDFNQAGELHDKQSRRELIGKSIFEMRPGVKEFGLIDAFRKAIKSGKPVHHPIRLYKDNRLTAWYDNYIYLQPSGELVAIFTDVTQMKIAEEALHENEKLLNEVGRIAKIGGWEMDLITRKAKWTQGTYDIVEINYGEPIPGPDEHLDYYLPEFRPKMEQAMKELIEKDIPLNVEAKGKTAKGNIKWFRAVGRAIRENGVCTKLFGTLQDITENKHAEEIINNHRRLLEKQMSLSKTLLDAIPCIAMLLKPETREIVASNKAAIKVGAIPGKTCYETWAQRDESCPWCMAPKLWETGEEQHIEVEYMGTVWDAYWIPVSDDLYMHFAFDITERKKYETSILQYQKQLKSLSSQLTLTEEKERYRIATHLHDHIGQYLAISRMKLVELINSDISEGTHNTLKLVDEWLHHSIQETRSLTFDLSSPILHELGIKKAIAAWLNDEIRIKHQIETEFYCDKPQISLDNDIQILLFRNVRELLFNAVKHAHASKIKVSIKAEDNNIQIIVEDDGVGFNPAEIVETAPGKAQFGLFSIRERLEQFGGNIKIDTAPGQGCRITLTAPKKKD